MRSLFLCYYETRKRNGIYHNIHCDIWLHIQLAAALTKLGRRRESIDELIFDKLGLSKDSKNKRTMLEGLLKIK